MDDFVLAHIFREIPEDIPALYEVSPNFRRAITNDPICRKVKKVGLTTNLYYHAIEENDLECMKYAKENKCILPFIDNFIMVNRYNISGIESLQTQICEKVHTQSETFGDDMCVYSLMQRAKKNCDMEINLNCIKFLHGEGLRLTERFAEYAIQHNYIDALKYYVDSGGKLISELFRDAAYVGNIECLRYMLSDECVVDSECYTYAVTTKNLRGVEEIKYKLEPDCCTYAASTGNIECLRLLVEHKCPMDEYTGIFALREDQFECFKYVMEHGCPYKYDTLISLSKGKNRFTNYIKNKLHVKMIDGLVIDKLDSSLLAKILKHIPERINDLYELTEKLKYTINSDPILRSIKQVGMTENLYKIAIDNNNIKCLKYAYKNVVQRMSHQPCLYALEKQRFECVRILHENGEQLTTEFGEMCISMNNTEMLEYYVAAGGILTKKMCINAIMTNSINLLKFLIDNGCEISEECCIVAATFNKLEYLEMLMSAGCKTSIYVLLSAIREKNYECFVYAIEHHCPYRYCELMSNCARRKNFMEYLVANEETLIANQ